MPKGNGFKAKDHPKSKAFMTDLLAVCEKHGMVVVPTYAGEVSFHDTMLLMPLERQAVLFLERTLVYPDDFPK